MTNIQRIVIASNPSNMTTATANMPISKLQGEVKSMLERLMKDELYSTVELRYLTGISVKEIEAILEDSKHYSLGFLNNLLDRIENNEGKHELVEDVSQFQKIWHTAMQARKGRRNRKHRVEPCFDLLVGGSGLGKSKVMRAFANQSRSSVYMVRLDKTLHYRELLERIALEMGLLDLGVHKAPEKRKSNWTAKYLMRIILNKLETNTDSNLSNTYPILIIDEAEEIPPKTLRKIKNFHTATEGLISIIICGMPETKLRLFKIAGLKKDGTLKHAYEQNIYTPFVRRMNVVSIPRISSNDLSVFCKYHGIDNKRTVDIIFSSGMWWNYQIATDMILHYGAETLNTMKDEKQFKALCSEFV